MPQSWVGGDRPGPHMEGICPQHGTVGLGPRMMVLRMIAIHYQQDHDGVSTLLEGKHFTLVEAPMRCDLCPSIVEPPWWTHKTSRPLAEFGDADGLWLVCDACHEALAQGTRALLERVAKMTSRGWESPSLAVVRAFAATTDAGVRGWQ